MKKNIKLLLSISSISSLFLPLVAISCSNQKTKLEAKIKESEIQLSNIEFANDFQEEFKNEIINAKKILSKEQVTNEELKNAEINLVNNLKKILDKNKQVIEEYFNNQELISRKINELKEYAHEKLSNNRELKAKLVKQYEEIQEEFNNLKSVNWTLEKTEEFKKKIDKVLNDIKKETMNKN
ncbi:variable surface lipoprotein [Metamycoplasma canadense]|uniref:Lipoprotein n=1 Tax=Metamycoplasma canadense TaxID=29554 RepID=A0A077L6W4_9BACT|nr:variable surface lipoprotein [Metamycoplasma canadense]BAP39536.1 hypothetical protein MCAN360_0353 [Metamycoplasma canadense]